MKTCEQNERLLWEMTLLFWVFGDLLTTIVGLQLPGVIEVGPLAQQILSQYGYAGLIVAKVVFTGFLFGMAARVPNPYHVGIPIGLTGVGIVITLWNSFVAGTALSVHF